MAAEWYYDKLTGSAGGSGSRRNPLANAVQALSLASDGDRLIGNGIFTGTDLGASGYFDPGNKSVELISLTDYSCTFAPSVVAAGVNIALSTYAKTLTIGDIIIGGADIVGGVTPNYSIWSQSTAQHQLVLNGTKITEFIFYGLNPSATNTLLNLDANNIEFVQIGSGRTMINSTSLGATAVIDINGLFINQPNKTNGFNLINLAGNQAGARVYIENFNIVARTTDNTTDFVGAIKVLNVDGVRAKRGAINYTNTNAVRSAYPIQVNCTSASLTANNALIEDVDIYVDTAAGIACAIGHDTSDAFDNRANNGLIKNVNVTGSDRFQAGLGHGLFLGNETGGRIVEGSAVHVGLGVVSKQTTDTEVLGVITRDMTSGVHIYFKGAVRARGIGNKTYQVAGDGPSFQAGAGDAGAGSPNCSGCYYGGNDFSLSGALTSKVINTTASQGVTFGPNKFWQATGTTYPNPAATIAGTDYATLALANAASDAGAQIISNSTIPLGEDSRGDRAWLSADGWMVPPIQ